jgi:hypothetical protein
LLLSIGLFVVAAVVVDVIDPLLLSIDLSLAVAAVVPVDQSLCCRSIYFFCCRCCRTIRSISLLSTYNQSLTSIDRSLWCRSVIDDDDMISLVAVAVDRPLCCRSISLLSINLSLAATAASAAVDEINKRPYS